MRRSSQGWRILVAIFLLVLSFPYSQAYNIKSKVFLSPKFELGPGSVENKFYYGVDFPKGHIALKSFNAEVVDEAGNPVPLHETYLHHWVVVRYYIPKDVKDLQESDYISAGNAGVCQKESLDQYFGLGSETRGTATHIPDPYGIEIGNPATIPEGHKEIWMMNVHAIDTRGVEDKLGCTECKCDLYNVTVDEYGKPIKPNYKGGLLCCYDHTQCRMKHGFKGPRRSLYLRYIVKWVDWDTSIVPVKIYIFDVTDIEKRISDSTGLSTQHHCLIEYDVERCKAKGESNVACIHTKRTSITMPTGGYIIYGVAHQHSGGIGAALYSENGQVMCVSMPAYGNGEEAGNEAGYIVGMSTCYPKPGSLKITDGGKLIIESNYSSFREHSGVMGLFYILVADRVPKSSSFLDMHQDINHSTFVWGTIILVGMIAVASAAYYRYRNKKGEGYQPIKI